MRGLLLGNHFPFAFGSVLQDGAFDPDAQAYITTVETADGQSLETAVKVAINNFVIGCKADGIWSAIKASCILAGARTLTGALTPLVGTAPTNFNFVSGDYNRKTGLVGDGSTKYLNSNRNNNADPQDNHHLGVYATSAITIGNHIVGVGGTTGITGSSHITKTSTNIGTRSRNTNFSIVSGAGSSTGLISIQRSNSANYTYRFGGVAGTHIQASQVPANADIQVFANESSGHINARLSFYSIGESLDLALLDARVTTLINDLGAAIP